MNVFIVEQSLVYRRMLEDILSRQPDCKVVGIAPSLMMARRKILDQQADIVILDTQSDSVGTAQLCGELLRDNVPVGVVVCTTSITTAILDLANRLPGGSLDNRQ